MLGASGKLRSIVTNTRTKLNEAVYFLARMRDTSPAGDEFGYNLSAFLSAARSVTLLMQTEVKSTAGFEAWWAQELKGVVKNARLLALLELFNDKRVDTVHIRPVVPAAQVEVEVHEVVHMVDAILVQKFDENGQLVETRSGTSPPPPMEPREPRIEWRWYFEELPDVDVITASEEYVGWLSSVVEECERRFQQPRSS